MLRSFPVKIMGIMHLNAACSHRNSLKSDKSGMSVSNGRNYNPNNSIVLSDIYKVNIRGNIILIMLPKTSVFFRRLPAMNAVRIKLHGTSLRFLQYTGILINVTQPKLELPALTNAKQISYPRRRISSEEIKKPSLDLFNT